jgi:hypothetical protein
MIALASFALAIPGRLNRIMNAVVPASLVRGMMAKMFKKTLAKPQPQETGVTTRIGK